MTYVYKDVSKQIKLSNLELVKTVLDSHNDMPMEGLTDNSFTMDLGESGLIESMRSAQSWMNVIADQLWNSITEPSNSHRMGSRNVPSYMSETTKYELLAKQVFAIRAIKHIANTTTACSARQQTRFSTRMISSYDIADYLSITSEASEKLETSQAYIQVKRDPKPNNPMLWSWLITVDGTTLARGKQLPLPKLITTLAKPLKMDTVVAENTIQASLIELGKLQVTDKKYYWYTTNQNIAANYITFRDVKSTDSCMSKQPDYYSDIPASQHPMMCYDDSPDWRLMFISDKSPQEIADMCDPENPLAFKYPFLTRCMVLPSEKELSQKSHDYKTPFVFGKIYGLEKIVNYFFSGSTTDGINNNGNPILTHLKNIAGGRIQRIPVRGSTDRWLLPYFDQANKAYKLDDSEGNWWVSTHTEHVKKHNRRCVKEDRIQSVWRGQYREGTARSVSVYSNLHHDLIDVDTYSINLMETALGMEPVHVVRNYYTKVAIAGQPDKVYVPLSWCTGWGGKKYLKSDCAFTLNGSMIPNQVILNSPDRYMLSDVYGVFDLQNEEDARMFAGLGLKVAENTPAESVEAPQVAVAA